MWIDHLELKNFRQYQNETIDFSGLDKDNGRFTVIRGTNGAGKTNILNAVTWCLYGREYHQKKDVDFPILNTKAKEKMEPEDQEEVEVEALFKDSDKRMIVTRTKGFRKTKGNALVEMSGYGNGTGRNTELKIMESSERNRGMEKVDNLVISNSMPESLHEYFFFDGERLDDYFRETSPKSVKKAVFRISQLKKFNDMINHIEKVKTGYRNESSKFSSKADKIQKEIERKEERLSKIEEDLKKRKERFRKARQKEEKFRRKLRDTDVEHIQELQKERERLKEVVKKDQKKKENKKGEKLDFLLEEVPKSLLLEPLIKTSEFLKDKEDAGEIPPNYKKNFIEKLLEDGNCICGADITSGERRKRVEDVLEKSDEITNISQELSELNATLRGIINSRKDIEKGLKNYNDTIDALKNKIESNRKRIKEIGPKVEDINKAEIKSWEDRRKTWENTKEAQREKWEELEGKKQQKKEEIEEKEEELEKEREKEEEGRKITKKINFCEEALRIAKTIKEKIMREVREEIEERTEKRFLDMIWKEKNYQEVRIGNEYEISAIDQQGTDATTALSAGERQSLALSFMAALNNVSGFEAPIIIDTPLGRIDKGKPKRGIAKNLPEALKGKQIIMLVTGSEYTNEVRDELAPYIGKEYCIDFKEDETGNRAEVKPL